MQRNDLHNRLLLAVAILQYAIVIRGDGTAGSYNLSWHVKGSASTAGADDV